MIAGRVRSRIKAMLVVVIAAATLFAGCGGGGAGDSAIPVSGAGGSQQLSPPVLSVFLGDPGGRGSVDADGEAARFDALNAISLDAGGAIFVTEYGEGALPSGNNAIRRISQQGQVTTVQRDAASAPACLQSPSSIDASVPGFLHFVARTTFCRVPVGGGVAQAVLPEMEVWSARADPAGRGWYLETRTELVLLDSAGRLNPVTARAGVTAFALDPRGNLFIHYGGSSVVRRTPSGSMNTVVDLTSAPWRMEAQRLLAVDGTGRLVFMRTLDTGILSVSPSGEVANVAAAGDACSLDRTALGPAATFAADGRLFYVDGVTVAVWAPGTARSVLAGRTCPDAAARLTQTPLLADSAGQLVTTSTSAVATNEVLFQKWGRDGRPTDLAPGVPVYRLPLSSGRFEATIDAADNFYIASTTWSTGSRGIFVAPLTSRIVRISRSGAVDVLYESAADRSGFVPAGSIAALPNGDLIVQDAVSGALLRLRPGAQMVSLAADGTLRAATTVTDKPLVRPDGRLVLFGANIRIVKDDGTAVVVAGGGGSSPSYDRTGQLYFRSANLVRGVAPDGTVSTLIGRANVQRNELGALPGAIYNGTDLALGLDGTLYFRSGNAILTTRVP